MKTKSVAERHQITGSVSAEAKAAWGKLANKAAKKGIALTCLILAVDEMEPAIQTLLLGGRLREAYTQAAGNALRKPWNDSFDEVCKSCFDRPASINKPSSAKPKTKRRPTSPAQQDDDG